ncbi:hypothetical protein RM697_08980 [Ichthyenterobacterium sp. W332]|uniref:DUF4878 domain-containing protein n=1 Tax=Microcosmobacter mediterraneus TaxID=3075607 RepID=A0ABU2YLS9_9FLAO|nr:hypothetical protein [Ichthyenterobacterium sp. W332]MDT0558780.1 hypothetical protein [Ichthyenterobacterium sp. W332]
MKNINLIFTIVILMFNASLFAQQEPKEIVEKFFKEFEEKSIAIALDNLYEQNKWISRSSDAIIQLKSQMEGLNKDFVGEYYGYELILEKNINNSYKLMSYLVKYNRQPIRFTFQFYRPNDTWRIQSFQYDGNIDDELEEKAKLYHYRMN